MVYIGVDIGGTKCAVTLGEVGENCTIIHKCEAMETKTYSVNEMLDCLVSDIQTCQSLLKSEEKISGIGISCGGPLNSTTGTILSPPNLPGWDNIHITDYFTKQTGLKAWLCNDANACALAEWKLGAGKGKSNMVFITFGTGLGAGMILNNHLYVGASDMAGELGHIRLNDFGPTGYGKMGSFEGFCSGGGIVQLARAIILEQLQMGRKPILCSSFSYLEGITAEKVGIAAKNGDELAKEILRQVGVQLGKGLAMVIDLLNPECIVIGSIFTRCYEMIWPYTEQVIRKEALLMARNSCQVVKSQLSESVGDMAALIVADYNANLELEGKL